VNDSLRVADLTVPDTVTVLTSVEETIASVVPPQAREVEEAEAEAVEGEAAEEEGAGATAEEAESAAEQTEE
jgi:hypothetical protein